MFTFLLMCLSQSDSESSPLFWREKKKRIGGEKHLQTWNSTLIFQKLSIVMCLMVPGEGEVITVCNENLLKNKLKK